MNRRSLLKLGGLALAGQGIPRLPLGAPALTSWPTEQARESDPDYSLRIAPVTVELDRSHILSTVGYNGTAPGPVLRMRAGRRVTVDVTNDTDTPELVHWHGMLVPPEVDGTEEESSPSVPPHGRRRFELLPGPAGSRRLSFPTSISRSSSGQVGAAKAARDSRSCFVILAARVELPRAVARAAADGDRHPKARMRRPRSKCRFNSR